MIKRDPAEFDELSSGIPYITPTVPVKGTPVLPAKGACPSMKTPSMATSMMQPAEGPKTYATTLLLFGFNQNEDGWFLGGFVDMNEGMETETLVSEISFDIAEVLAAQVHDNVESAPVTEVAHILTPTIFTAANAEVAKLEAPEVLHTANIAQKSD